MKNKAGRKRLGVASIILLLIIVTGAVFVRTFIAPPKAIMTQSQAFSQIGMIDHQIGWDTDDNGKLYATTDGAINWNETSWVVPSGQARATTVDTPEYKLTVPFPLQVTNEIGGIGTLYSIKGKPAGWVQMINYYPDHGDMFGSIIGNHAEKYSRKKIPGYDVPAYELAVARTQPAAAHDDTITEEKHIILMPENYYSNNAHCAIDLMVYADLVPVDLLESMAKSLVIKDYSGGLINTAGMPGEEQIVLSGRKIAGRFTDFSLKVGSKKRLLNWENVIDPTLSPQLLLSDINRDGKKELIVILTVSNGIGINTTHIHLLDPPTLKEIPMADAEAIKAEIGDSFVEITVGKQKRVISRYNPWME